MSADPGDASDASCAVPRKKIGILLAGHVPGSALAAHRDYDSMFIRLLGETFRYSTYAVTDGQFPASPGKADGWLVTGSKHGVNDGHDWIATLKEFLRRAHDAPVPVVGICFGHQIMASALGGKVAATGWNVGPQDYALAERSKPARLIAWHHDQVVSPPSCSATTGSSAGCPIAELRYGMRAYTIQPHPEFTFGFAASLLESRRDGLPGEIAARTGASLNGQLDNELIANRIRTFFDAQQHH